MSYIKWLAYFVSEVLQNIRVNIAIIFVTILTIAISLSICALFFGFFVNLHNMLGSMGGQIQITAYLKNGLSGEAISDIKKNIADMPEVEDIEYISKEKAFSLFSAELKKEKGILDGLSADPFPASLEIRVKRMFRNQTGIEGLIARLNSIAGIEDIQYAREWVDRFFTFIRFVEIFAFVIGGFILMATVFVVSNTIRLAVYTRREEIDVMELLGAAPIFIKAPFLIEGTVTGFLGAVLAICMLYIGRSILLMQIPAAFLSLVDTPFSPAYFSLGIIAAGGVLGMLGSIAALWKFTRV